MTSGRPPTFDATTGTSHAIASSAASPKLSCADGSRKTSDAESSGITSSCAPSISTSGVMFSSRPRRYAVPSSGPSPTSSNRAGTARLILAKTSITASIRLTGRKFDTWMTSFVASSGAKRCRRPGTVAPPVDLAVEAIGDDLDVAADAELAARGLAQALGHGGHAVRRLDRVGDDLRKRWIAPDQRDVGAVQRRHDPRDGVTAGLQHLSRQQRRRGVRDRVVRVDDLQRELARHLHDLVGERQDVLRFAKERIARRVDLVEHQPGLIVAEPERRIGADEVHLVAAVRERLGQLGRDDPASADRRVADDADIHGSGFRVQGSGFKVQVQRRYGFLKRSGRTIRSFTTTPSANATPASAPNWASRLSTSCSKSGDVSRVSTPSLTGTLNWLT